MGGGDDGGEYGVSVRLGGGLMLFGRVMTDGRVNARVRCDLSENLAMKANAQSVTPHLSLGGEVFWAGQHRKSGMAMLLATTQIRCLPSTQVSLASDFMYNHMSRDVTASFGYDYILRQCRLRGQIDSNGCVAAFLEERLNMGLNFTLSAEVDIKRKITSLDLG
ncbi:hypothetical protein RND71_006835 [Anisodus tanguticus]|uniref:Mitochondrial import receptor subunit TOM40-1 n=1 Tax=Anisodus tanguticus TaxID=243964 RepID=A0AAE1SUX9_9SOLA|nr:hypothetical protein RND71_006835 [Anisodus tanguticus]